MNKINLLPPNKMKELIMHCNRQELPVLEEKILIVMSELGLRVRAVPSISKQSLTWQAITPTGILAVKYERKYEYGFYNMHCDLIALDENRTRQFYEKVKRL